MSTTIKINPRQPAVVVDASSPKYVYGLSGIARLFGCSIPTANRIKKSGKIDKAIKQIGRKIIVDAEACGGTRLDPHFFPSVTV